MKPQPPTVQRQQPEEETAVAIAMSMKHREIEIIVVACSVATPILKCWTCWACVPPCKFFPLIHHSPVVFDGNANASRLPLMLAQIQRVDEQFRRFDANGSSSRKISSVCRDARGLVGPQ
jgi:hypothetical protein